VALGQPADPENILYALAVVLDHEVRGLRPGADESVATVGRRCRVSIGSWHAAGEGGYDPAFRRASKPSTQT